MTRIYAVANQKGGVGKTTTCVNLAASLVATKKRVLLVDLDPQGNATMGSGVDKNALERTVYDVLTQRAEVRRCLTVSGAGKYHLLPANGDVTAAEVEMLHLDDKEKLLHRALSEISDDYDYIIIDCPPSLNMLTVNALAACNGVIIPMQCEYYALEGLTALMNTLEGIRARVNPELKIEGLLRTMYDPRNSLTNDVSAQLIQHFGDRVYRTCIPRNVRLAEAPSFGEPVLSYDRQSKGAISYLALAGEILRRNEAHSNTAANAATQ